MRVIVVGASEPAGALCAALNEAGGEADLIAGDVAQRLDNDGLARALVEIEQRVEAMEPDVIVTVGPGDATTAATLVAAKAGLRLAVLSDEDPADGEQRAVRELGSERHALPRDGAAVAQIAGEIVGA